MPEDLEVPNTLRIDYNSQQGRGDRHRGNGDRTPLLDNNQLEQPPFQPDEVVSERYKIIEELGSGSYGIVYKAFDLKLKQKVALKALRYRDREDPDLLKDLFYREVRNAQALTHRNLCRVHDLGEDQGRPYFSMAYAEGQDLKKYLRKKRRLDKTEIIAIASQLCKGLEELHVAGYLHRDLKPENIIHGYDGKILITDFGLVELAERCQNGMLVGTRPYMAPEILQNIPPDRASDIYSLGVILYELATGRLPFVARRLSSLVREIEQGPVYPRIHVEGMNRHLEKIVLACLSFDASARPTSAKEIESLLAAAVRDASFEQNPFVSDRAVSGSNFQGNNRENNIKIALSRISKRQSTFVVGDLRTGKTSFLLRLADRIESELGHVILRTYSLQSVPDSYCPADFWRDALETISTKLSDEKTLRAIEAAIISGFTQTRLESLFSRIFEKNHVFALLLDEFESLLQHPNFPANFFALLRSLIMSTSRALVIIPTSRFSMKEIEKRSKHLKRQIGSKYFNYFTEIDLGPLDEDAADDLLSLSGPHFTTPDKLLIRTLAGRQPYLLQMLAENLFNAHKEKRWFRAASRFYDKTLMYFDDLWDGWSGPCRSASVFLHIAEWSHRLESDPLKLSSSDLSKNDLRVGLRELARSGLLGAVDEEGNQHIRHTFAWEGELWGLSVEVFTWWFRDLALMKTRTLRSYTGWLNSERRRRETILEKYHLEKLDSIAGLAKKDARTQTIESFISNFADRFSSS